MAAKNKPNEINLQRIYDAPVKLVWEAWTDPQQVAQWWGPRGFTLTTKSKDLKVGGHWVYTMHGPDGVDYPNKTTYYEVDRYKKLVYDHGANDNQPALFRVTVLFSEIKGQTHMDMTMSLATAEAAKEIKKHIKAAGGNSTWDRLAEYLDKKYFNKDRFVINRTFDAPIEKLFEMWTNPKHFSQWLAPTDFDMHFIRSDIAVGKSTFYFMSNDSGMKMYGRADYKEVVRPNRLVYTQEFCDADEKMSRHPMAPTWPATMLTTVTLTAESSDQTRVTITWEPYGDFTVEEMDTFIKAKSGMTQGWTGSFDKLDDYIEKNK